ncbi:uncharacterized protein LOC102720754 [Oryza brachyantha]|uniref:uncharacterized protein LOC102720754 n=1 Tax=Oryza brachyantha TaxID=4533 RepID=UPI001ADD2AEA|nr:uncharacterized protein LOC102720754 [Oryza brachyantha]
MTMEHGTPGEAEAEAEAEDYGSWTLKQRIDDIVNSDPINNVLPKHPEHRAYFEKKLKEKLEGFVCVAQPKLLPVLLKDNVKHFYQVYNLCSRFMGIRNLLYPDLLTNMASFNALRCARVALEGTPPLRGRHADPNILHRYGFSPLHVAAENFNVAMVKLLFRYGASANIRTKGSRVIEGLLPLHVAVENATMHKYLEDHWTDGDNIIRLILLLCLPEMKMFLDTTRLIAKHTDNIVEEVCGYIHEEMHVHTAILLLAAQKQLRGRLNKSSGEASLNGFDILKSCIDDALDTIHLEGLTMVKQGKNGKALKRLKDRKEALLTAHALVRIVDKAGIALEGYIQTHSQVPHDGIVQHVLSILQSNGFAHSGESIDTGKLECYQHHGGMPIGKTDSQRVGSGETIEAEKSSSDKCEVSKRILGKQPPKGLGVKDVRNMFFPYWKSVLSRRLEVNKILSSKPSWMDSPSAEANKEGSKTIYHPSTPNKPIGNVGSMGWTPLSSESRRMLCTAASISQKVFKRT